MGYKNHDNTDLTITRTTEGERNIISPLEFNGAQTELFRSGTHPFAFAITLPNEKMTTTGVSWSLGEETVTITSSDITRDNQCNLKYNGRCTTEIEGFCSDGDYCNGIESCSPKPSVYGKTAYGTCTQSNTIVECPDGMSCDSDKQACVNQEEKGGNTDFSIASVMSCVTQSDCDPLTNYCNGPSYCISQTCQYNPLYDACPSENSLNNTIVQGSGRLVVTCSEENRKCVSYYMCTADSECTKDTFCSGISRCIGKVCMSGKPVQCADETLPCDEVTRCNNQVINDTSLDAQDHNSYPPHHHHHPHVHHSLPILIFGIIFVAGMIILIIIIIYWIVSSMYANNAALAQSSTNAHSNMQSRISQKRA